MLRLAVCASIVFFLQSSVLGADLDGPRLVPQPMKKLVGNLQNASSILDMAVDPQLPTFKQLEPVVRENVGYVVLHSAADVEDGVEGVAFKNGSFEVASGAELGLVRDPLGDIVFALQVLALEQIPVTGAVATRIEFVGSGAFLEVQWRLNVWNYPDKSSYSMFISSGSSQKTMGAMTSVREFLITIPAENNLTVSAGNETSTHMSFPELQWTPVGAKQVVPFKFVELPNNDTFRLLFKPGTVAKPVAVLDNGAKRQVLKFAGIVALSIFGGTVLILVILGVYFGVKRYNERRRQRRVRQVVVVEEQPLMGPVDAGGATDVTTTGTTRTTAEVTATATGTTLHGATTATTTADNPTTAATADKGNPALATVTPVLFSPSIDFSQPVTVIDVNRAEGVTNVTINTDVLVQQPKNTSTKEVSVQQIERRSKRNPKRSKKTKNPRGRAPQSSTASNP